MSIIVVIPPAKAAFVAVSNPSQDVRPKRWGNMRHYKKLYKAAI